MTTSFSPLTVALCACCLVLGSTGGAVAGAKITGKQIKNESVTGKDVRNGSLTAHDLASGSVSGPRGPAGPKGEIGAPGAPGADGTDGTDGVSGFQTLQATDSTQSAGQLSTSRSCAGSRSLLGAFGYLDNSVHPVMVIWDDANTASAFSSGAPAGNTLTLTITCANVS
jgi:hypothetical protein